MSQGVILYLQGRGELQGNGELPEGLQPGFHYPGLCLSTRPVEVVVSQHGILELEEAWHFLLTRGCEPIHLLLTRPEQDRLRPIYPLVRLTGSRVMEGLLEACSQRRGLH
jgi:hypothetical protein